jgi:hypothetical protein
MLEFGTSNTHIADEKKPGWRDRANEHGVMCSTPIIHIYFFITSVPHFS